MTHNGKAVPRGHIEADAGGVTVVVGYGGVLRLSLADLRDLLAAVELQALAGGGVPYHGAIFTDEQEGE